jgi:hypothetical protein
MWPDSGRMMETKRCLAGRIEHGRFSLNPVYPRLLELQKSSAQDDNI